MAKQLTRGQLPSREEFEAAFEQKCPEGVFPVRGDKRVGDHNYDWLELYYDMQLALDEAEMGGIDNPYDGEEWTSSILQAFGFEWVRMTRFTTSYCNRPHRLSDGVPIDHNCHVLPVRALVAEKDGEIRQAMTYIEEKRPLREHRGIREGE